MTFRASYKVGDPVRWTSNAAGKRKEKRGRVVEVVTSGGIPSGITTPGRGRDHESYVVNVDGRKYWPRVSHLEDDPTQKGSTP